MFTDEKYLKLIPEKLRKRLGKTSYGPNCWNCTTVFCQPNKRIQFVGGEYMDRWLNKYTSNIDEKKAKSGDIIVFRSPANFNNEFLCAPNSDIVHSVVIVGKTFGDFIVFHKEGYEGEYRIDLLSRVKKVYNYADVFEFKKYTGEKANTKKKAA